MSVIVADKIKVGDTLTIDCTVIKIGSGLVSVRFADNDLPLKALCLHQVFVDRFKEHTPVPRPRLQVDAPVGTKFHLPGSPIIFVVEAWVNGYLIAVDVAGRSDVPVIISSNASGDFERYEVYDG